MKKDAIALPLLPFTDDEETALNERLSAMDSATLGHYVDSARNSLGNNALDPSWRPRIQFGLERAEAALLVHAATPVVVEAPPPPVPAKAAKTTKASKAAAAKLEASRVEAAESEGDSGDGEASDAEASDAEA